MPAEFVAQCRRRFQDFVERHGAGCLVLCHSDADGLAAGAIIGRALRRPVIATGKGGNAWAPETGQMLSVREPSALIVCDLGLRAEPVLPGVPTFIIDHHQPTGTPADEDTFVTGYAMEPTPTSGLLARACVGSDEIEASDWIAAISILSDLGDKTEFPVVARAKKSYGAGVLRDATTLLNAPRRSASGDASPALSLLLSVAHPREIVTSDRPEAAILAHAKVEVNAAYNEAKKAAPKFAGEVAMIRIHTPCQVHPLIAQIWRTRLPKHIVFGVNTGYVPGWVHFSGRCGRVHNLLTFLREHRPDGASNLTYGNGHDQAGGGALPDPIWNQWVTSLGFGPEMLVGAAPAQPPVSQPELFS